MNSISTAVEVLLERVHLPAQDVPKRLHLRQLLPQTVTLLRVTYANLFDFRLGRHGIFIVYRSCFFIGIDQYWTFHLCCVPLTLKEEVEVAEYPLVADVRESIDPCLLKLDSEP